MYLLATHSERKSQAESLDALMRAMVQAAELSGAGAGGGARSGPRAAAAAERPARRDGVRLPQSLTRERMRSFASLCSSSTSTTGTPGRLHYCCRKGRKPQRAIRFSISSREKAVSSTGAMTEFSGDTGQSSFNVVGCKTTGHGG